MAEGWLPRHDFFDDRLEDALVGGIIDSLLERKVHRVLAPLSRSDVVDFTSFGEEVFSILVEADRHYPITGPESLLDTISVMDIDVNVKDTGEGPEEFQGPENDVFVFGKPKWSDQRSEDKERAYH